MDAMTESTPALSSTTTQPPSVSTDAGPVTMIDLPGLRLRCEALRQEAQDLTRQAESLKTLSEELWVEVGRILVSRIKEWSPPTNLAELVQQAVPLTQKLTEVEAQLESIKGRPRPGLGGVIGKMADWNESRTVSSDSIRTSAELEPILAKIGREAPDVSFPDSQVIKAQAIAADTQAQTHATLAEQSTTAANLATNELERRTEAEREMGFDPLYLTAYLRTHGPQAIQSPLILKHGEHAYAAVQATLARHQTRTHWVGGSQGFSFPIGHTGIRYRVGSYSGHPVAQQFMAHLSSGTLVVSNQRLAFIGTTKSTSVPFTKLLHIECYSDALGVFQEGRETPDFYLVAQPKYVLFFINWFLSQATV